MNILGIDITSKTKRSVLIALLRQLSEIEPHFTAREIAKARCIPVERVKEHMRSGVLSPSHQDGTTNPWTASLSAIRRYDEQTAIRLAAAGDDPISNTLGREVTSETKRSVLIALIEKLGALEPHFTDREIARARRISVERVREHMRNGVIAPAHHDGQTNPWTAPLSAIRRYDEQTATLSRRQQARRGGSRSRDGRGV